MVISFKKLFSYSTILLVCYAGVNAQGWNQQNNLSFNNNIKLNCNNNSNNNNLNNMAKCQNNQQWNQFNNNPNNNWCNNGVQQFNIANFYKNPALVKNYLYNKITSVNNNGIQINYNNFNNFDWQLFLFNLKNSKSAKTNIICCLNSLINNEIAINNGISINDQNSYVGTDNIIKSINNLFGFWCGTFNTRGFYNGILNNVTELINMIANHYILNIMSGCDNISLIQNSLPIFPPSNNLANIFFNNYGYFTYWQNYYLPRLTQQNYERAINDPSAVAIPYRTFDKVTNNEWNIAVNIVKQIDLAGILKKLIIGINVGEILFNKEYSNNSTTANNVNPILLRNGNSQCWFNSSLQLINSAVECSSQEVKNTLQSNMGYVLISFLQYLQNKSAKYFNTNDIIVKTSWNNNNGLLLIDELNKFEQTLDSNVSNTWNALPGVKEGKEIIKRESTRGISSNCPMAFSILEKIFPELSKLFIKN